jgi:hypothetical protein
MDKTFNVLLNSIQSMIKSYFYLTCFLSLVSLKMLSIRLNNQFYVGTKNIF